MGDTIQKQFLQGQPIKKQLIFPLIFGSLLIAACSSVGQGIQVPQSPLLAAVERKSGLIAYLGPDGNVYTIDKAGGKLNMVTDDAHAQQGGVQRFYDFPTWSTEDNKLAFVGFDVREDGSTTASIFATDKKAEDAQEIYSSDAHVPFYLYWSPDGEWVSFLSSTQGTSAMAMQITPAEGGETSVVDTGRPYYWAWSPSSPEVIAHAGGSAAINPGGARLSLVEMKPAIRETGLGIQPTNFQAPAYSPDGDYVLLAGDTGGQQQLILADAAGHVQSTLTDFEGSIAFDWAPKGDFAAYLTAAANNQALVGSLTFLDLRRPDQPELIPSDAEDVMGFFWAPDGKKLAFFVPVILSQAAEGEEQSDENTRFLLELYIAEPKSGTTDRIAAFQPTQTFLNIFPFFDQFQRSATIWSPDSRYIVVSAAASESTEGLFIVPASGDFEPRFLTEARVGFWSWE
jgi:Tol biopolymer transport system component